MPDRPFLVTGATGNVGREVVRALRAAGEPVQMGVHAPDAGHGGDTVRLDFEDPATFAEVAAILSSARYVADHAAAWA